MTANLLKQAAADASSPSGISAIAETEGAKIGAAAERKRQEESADSLAAVLESESKGGRGVYWRRRIRANGEVRHVAMVERAGAYDPAAFLRLANRSAAAAVMGGWRNAEAVESVGAEIVARVLTKTSGRMPTIGSLGRQIAAGSEDPDAAYLTGLARTVIASAQRGDSAAAGLAAEAVPMAAAEGAETFDLAAAMADATTAAEQAPDRYLNEPIAPKPGVYGPAAPARGDLLTGRTRGAAWKLAVEAGRKGRRAHMAALVAALRPELLAVDIAAHAEGVAPSAPALRKSKERGLASLATQLGALQGGPRAWGAADWRLAESLASLCVEDQGTTVSRPLMEQNGPAPYRGVSLNWPSRIYPDQVAPVRERRICD